MGRTERTPSSFDIDVVERAKLNTTINREVYMAFKDSCRRSGIAMNVLIEAFMRQYAEGDFFLKFDKNRSLEVDLHDGLVNMVGRRM